jgi:hypothetical protein
MTFHGIATIGDHATAEPTRAGKQAHEDRRRSGVAQGPRKDHECDPILALAQRTLLVPMLYLLMEVLRIGARLCVEVDALDDLCVLSLSGQIRERFVASPSGPILQRRFVSEVLLNGVNFGTCNHNNSGIIRARERVLVANVCHFVCG